MYINRNVANGVLCTELSLGDGFPLGESSFVRVGEWELDGNRSKPSLYLHHDLCPTIYAFVVNSEIQFVAHTNRPLNTEIRSYGYAVIGRNAHNRLNVEITKEILKGNQVSIWALVEWEPMFLGNFELNVPAALVDPMIKQYNPIWNTLVL